ncbi:alpha-ketoglutarate-dependent dioxygenase AlkB family protein [Limnovirga soli]|uniref:Alpha-ketoglutarate-dependent dioxygenase AlkB n=1 Tax=Limnovirga soli TaxID=2656915 RepID=A0A8J8JVA9_9BACT|nr:alpha-ketoglutarate-dependent dioxygenase AlkB [Limnovirga soli]NNV57200.1 alpha-ketoglutarate-dependent dioxygenase AlkB [Limnovirga soli]
MKTNIELPNAECILFTDIITDTEYFFQQLKEQIEWEHKPIKIMGKEILQPRLTAWYGEKQYNYSGTENLPKPFIKPLLELKEIVEATINKKYNACLLNYYRSGNDSIGWHSDLESQLHESIASVSLGVTREFQFKSKETNAITKLFLHDGSILEMGKNVQKLYKHQVPKRKLDGGRINVTFRQVK